MEDGVHIYFLPFEEIFTGPLSLSCLYPWRALKNTQITFCEKEKVAGRELGYSKWESHLSRKVPADIYHGFHIEYTIVSSISSEVLFL